MLLLFKFFPSLVEAVLVVIIVCVSSHSEQAFVQRLHAAGEIDPGPFQDQFTAGGEDAVFIQRALLGR